MTADPAPPDELSGLRILELGSHHVFRATFPQNTDIFLAALRPMPDGDRQLTPWSWRGFRHLLRALGGRSYDLVVVHPILYAPWDPRYVLRCLGKLGPGSIPYLLKWYPIFLTALFTKCRLVVVDFEDACVLPRHNLWLARRAEAYYKRELPDDPWRLLIGQTHPRLPTLRVRRRRRLHRALDKLRPIGLGIPPAIIDPTAGAAGAEKVHDIYFAGDASAVRWNRHKGLPELLALRQRGIDVHVPDGRQSRAEYYEACRKSWLVWSPEGLGWDCFRHYEALALGAIPVISRPTIRLAGRLEHGRNCFFYDPEPGGLTAAVEAALADRPRLTAMCRAAPADAAEHHTLPRRLTGILRDCGLV